VALGIATVLWFAAGGELLSRFEGGWRIATLKLEPRAVAPAPRSPDEAAPEITFAAWTDPAWFHASPAHLEKSSDPELVARTVANPTSQQQENYLWNSALLEHPNPAQVELIRGLKEKQLFSFPSYDGSPHPPFRLYPDRDFRPTNWITNHWGWLSADMTVRKPSRTIRVGIIGDSTSHNFYGFYLQSFLNAWAQARGLEYRFEVANGARQGLGFEDGLAVLKYELAPMGLDYVVEYFAPSFSLTRQTMVQLSGAGSGIEAGAPAASSHFPIPASVQRAAAGLAPYSALARELSGAAAKQVSNGLLSEPAKPHAKLRLPVNPGADFDLLRARRDPYLGRIAGQLDTFQAVARTLHATPFVATERVCVWPGMQLRGGADDRLFQILNGPHFWPFSYEAIREMLAIHNGTIAAWAKANRVGVVDIDGELPRRTENCVDPWHDNAEGQRMRAWIIFQTIAPQILKDIESHQVPRDNAEPEGIHPYLEKPIGRIDAAEWAARVSGKLKAEVQARNAP